VLGPYSPAILRINIAFPTQYPDLPPLVTFATDIFHPLLVPLTTQTFSSSASDANDTFSASDGDRLRPGGFSLRDGFPGWFGTPPQNAATNRPRIVEVLVYMKSTFEDATMLDNIPLEAAGNPGAWHAWQSHRGVSKASTPSISPIEARRSPEAGSQTLPGNWNWEGVWESRVKIAIENSLSDPVLYGPKGGRGGDKRADMVSDRGTMIWLSADCYRYALQRWILSS
jgi:Ubiquitin-conjugating enzyme